MMDEKDLKEHEDNIKLVSRLKKSNKFNYIQGKRTEEHGSRIYDILGMRLPSVTSILAKTKDQKYLTDWKNKVGHEEAERIKNLSSKRGLPCISSLRNTYKSPVTKTLRQLASRLNRWLRKL